MSDPDYDVVIIGGGVGGIYQLFRLVESGAKTTLLEANDDLGGTWYANRYPGCRFDSESFTYGYSFSKELLQEWDWTERFSSQPENLRYLNYVTDRFGLRQYMQFNSRVQRAVFDESLPGWRVSTENGSEISCRFLLTALGQVSAPTVPKMEGMELFRGPSFHTYAWPHEGIDLEGKRVGVVGTGASGVQVIAAIADKVAQLTVFQRHPNWCAPLGNGPISDEEMKDIKARYDEIFDICGRTPGGFIHEPDRRRLFEVLPDDREALWEDLYGKPGFGIWLSNFRDIFLDDAANAEFSAFIAEKIRQRVKDPEVAEKLIPKDHGFGVHRVPLETNYYEAYNHENVQLVDLQATPIEAVTASGIRTTAAEYDLDVIVYATGFDAVTGAYDRLEIVGAGGQRLRDKWADGPVTYLGTAVHGFPNLLLVAGPQSGSAATNYPRAIELSVNWITDLLQYMWKSDYTLVEATKEAEDDWVLQVVENYNKTLMRKAKSWFTGYNSNVEGHTIDKTRYLIYNGGAPKFRRIITEIAENEYEGLILQ